MFILLGLILSIFTQAQNHGIFKDLKTYYESCGLVGKDDPRFKACNPPYMSQIMEGFKKDPKNRRDMEKIARFHMTHSLQKEAKESLKLLQKEMRGKSKTLNEMSSTWKSNQHFVITFSPQCKLQTSLDLGQKLKDYSDHRRKILKETLENLKKFPCEKAPLRFEVYAVGVVDVTDKADVWMINEKGELNQIIRSTGKTPFED